VQLVGLEGGNVAKTFPPSFIFSNTQKEKYFLKNDFQNEITLLLGILMVEEYFWSVSVSLSL